MTSKSIDHSITSISNNRQGSEIPKNRKTEKVAQEALKAAPAPTVAPLDAQRVSSNFFVRFLNFIWNLLSVFLPKKDQPSETPIPKVPAPAATPAPTKTAEIVDEKAAQFHVMLSEYKDAITTVAKTTLSKIEAEKFVNRELAEAAKIYDANKSIDEIKVKLFERIDPFKKQVMAHAYTISLLVGLRGMFPESEEKAADIFKRIHPAYYERLNELLNDTSLNPADIKARLAARARELIKSLEAPQPLKPIDANIPRVVTAPVKMQPTSELEESREWLRKTLNDPKTYQGGSLTSLVLESLGYDAKKYHEVEFFKSAMETMYFNFEKSTDLPSVKELRQEFKSKLGEIKFRNAGVHPDQVGNLRALLSHLSEERKTAIAEAEKASKTVKINVQLPKAKAFIQRMFLERNRDKIDAEIARLLTASKDKIRGDLASSSFKPGISLPQRFKNSFHTPSQDILKAEKWFEKYQGMVRSELQQGEDQTDLVGEGVCLGVSYRMATMVLDAPDKPAVIRSNTLEDRKIQDYHIQNAGKKHLTALPHELLAQRKQKEIMTFVANGDGNVKRALAKHLQELQESNGGVILGWGDHGTFMRFDTKRSKFSFFDTNFVTLVFVKKHDQSFPEVAKLMSDAYVELYEWAYPERSWMIARQIVPLKAREVTTDEVDLENVPIYQSDAIASSKAH